MSVKIKFLSTSVSFLHILEPLHQFITYCLSTIFLVKKIILPTLSSSLTRSSLRPSIYISDCGFKFSVGVYALPSLTLILPLGVQEPLYPGMKHRGISVKNYVKDRVVFSNAIY